MSNVPATLFYFPTADALKGFHLFDVVQTFPVIGSGDSVTLWVVTGYALSNGQNTVLAEFHAQGNAETFRDMCAIVARS